MFALSTVLSTESVIMLSVLFLLFFKHWYIDFVRQTDEQVKYKGVYGHPVGLGHSAEHGLATALIFCIFISFGWAIFLGLVDFVLHYHIDYAKMRYGNRDIKTKQFWAQLGLDQFAHQITYLILTAFAVAIGT